MNEIKLNLARKWRSRNFDQIIGQDLSIRMLKNSLYLGHYFPVYLFSGQRGCGKTSTARVFAAALNCEQLSAFQKNPQATLVPCLSCASCTAMAQGKHPDFVEIDAASHTGVDNVRSLIDSASLLPIMGNKKIYLVDEAHMLSKAAFNAFLKILEEPPSSVVFILATTDPQKILETVKSRCFQLFFKPVVSTVLRDRLQLVCDKENIAYDEQGLEAIIKETEGCVRDALNMLEQVRFSSDAVTQTSVLSVLGYMRDDQLAQLFECALFNTPEQLLQLIKEIQLEQFNPGFIWTRLIELTRALLWAKYGIQPQQFVQQLSMIKNLARRCSVLQLNTVLEILYTNEPLFLKTTAQYPFLEMLLLRLCQNNSDSDNEGGPSSSHASPAEPEFSDQPIDEEQEDEEDEQEEDSEEEDDALQARWKQFLQRVGVLEEPLLNSIFTQGELVTLDEQSHRLDIAFSKDFKFFKEWLGDSESIWLPLLHEVFSSDVVLNPLFTKESVAGKKDTHNQRPASPVDVSARTAQPERPVPVRAYQARKNTKKYHAMAKPVDRRYNKDKVIIDVSDSAVWKKAQLILRYFPGTVTELDQRV